MRSVSKKHDEYKKRIGENIRKARLARGLTQRDLDKAAGLSHAVDKIETGTNMPMLNNLYSICEALNVNIHEILPTNKKPKYRIPLNK